MRMHMHASSAAGTALSSLSADDQEAVRRAMEMMKANKEAAAAAGAPAAAAAPAPPPAPAPPAGPAPAASVAAPAEVGPSGAPAGARWQAAWWPWKPRQARWSWFFQQ